MGPGFALRFAALVREDTEGEVAPKRYSVEGPYASRTTVFR